MSWCSFLNYNLNYNLNIFTPWGGVDKSFLYHAILFCVIRFCFAVFNLLVYLLDLVFPLGLHISW